MKIGSENSVSYTMTEVLDSVIPAPRTANYTVSVDAVNSPLEVGTMMAIVANKLVKWNGAGVPAGILSERVDVATTESITTVYNGGLFKRDIIQSIDGANYATFVTAVNGTENAVHNTLAFNIA